MGEHFKLGLYEHQSASAIAGLFNLLARHPQLAADADAIQSVRISIYEPAFSIIGDLHKRDPRTRQSADHSMVYIVATLLSKAIEWASSGPLPQQALSLWSELITGPADFTNEALFHPLTRKLMERIDFRHGGPEYDAKYPDGLPTLLEIDHEALGTLSSGLVLYPEGHARNTSGNLDRLLQQKFLRLAGLGVRDPAELLAQMTNLEEKSSREIAGLYCFEIEPAA